MTFKLLYAGDDKIVIKVPPIQVKDETLDILIVYPWGQEFLTKKDYFRMKSKCHFEVATKQRRKKQDFKDFLILNGAIEEIFGLDRDDDDEEC
jgi:hypothetical protein